MYAALMSLPFFKGVTEETVSDILEKTKLDLITYPKNHIIVSQGDPVERLGLILNGSLRFTTSLCEGKVLIGQTIPAGNWMMPEYLFGMERSYTATVISLDKSCLLWLDKEQMTRMFVTIPLCRLNLLNYLAYRAQCRQHNATNLLVENPLERWLIGVLINTTERRATNIKVKVGRDMLSKLLNLSVKATDECIRKLCEEKPLEYSNGAFIVHNRRDYF